MGRKRASLTGSLLLVVVAGLWLAPAQALADDGRCHHRIRAAVEPQLDSGITGRAKLCVNREGVSGRLELEHRTPHDAYTVWFVYLDDPSKCVGGGPGVCGDADFGGDKPLAATTRRSLHATARRNSKAGCAT
jgi:hypothetical protein